MAGLLYKAVLSLGSLFRKEADSTKPYDPEDDFKTESESGGYDSSEYEFDPERFKKIPQKKL